MTGGPRAVVLTGVRWGVSRERDRNISFTWGWWRRLGLPVTPGHHRASEGPYSMAVASNRAARHVGDWDVALYYGSDFYAPHEQASAAIARAVETGRLTFAHNHLRILDEHASAYAVANEGRLPEGVDLGGVYPNTFSGVLAFPRSLWDAVEGFDERFVGWGWEDIAFWSACWALGGGFERVDGPHWHLWHPKADERHDGYAANERLGRSYQHASQDPGRTRAIIASRDYPSHP